MQLQLFVSSGTCIDGMMVRPVIVGQTATETSRKCLLQHVTQEEMLVQSTAPSNVH